MPFYINCVCDVRKKVSQPIMFEQESETFGDLIQSLKCNSWLVEQVVETGDYLSKFSGKPLNYKLSCQNCSKNA